MKVLLSLSIKSLWNRRFSVALTVFSISISVLLLLGVEEIRTQTRDSFTQTISGTDLIVGARSGPVQLLLYSVFHIGDATNNISWSSYQEINRHPSVAWSVPISLGDSHRGFRVMGTSSDYFHHYRYAREGRLAFQAGKPFADLYDAVIGVEVADALSYKLNEKIILAHGLGQVSFAKHEDKPFRVVGILVRTGTPVDKTVLISLEGIEAIHIDWQQGTMPQPGQQVSADQARNMQLQPKAITAFMLGLKSKIATFQLQRSINEYAAEPLSAILPGVALQQLWSMLITVETALLVISACVALAGLLGLTSALLTSLNERRREMAILRSVGSRPWHIFSLLVAESGIIALAGCCFGILWLYIGIIFLSPVLQSAWGMSLTITMPDSFECIVVAVIVASSVLISTIPAWLAYRQALNDGMMPRL